MALYRHARFAHLTGRRHFLTASYAKQKGSCPLRMTGSESVLQKTIFMLKKALCSAPSFLRCFRLGQQILCVCQILLEGGKAAGTDL